MPITRRRSQRLTVLVAALGALALTLVPVAGASHQFSDVPTNHPFHNEISILKDSNITSGCTATTFCPDDFVKRQAMAAFLDRALGLVVRPGESVLSGVAGSRVAMLDDGTSLVQTNDGGLELSYNGQRILRLVNNNVIGGAGAALLSNGNGVADGVFGAAIGGGGDANFGNRVQDNFGTVAGGRGNWAGSDDGNPAASQYASVGGGLSNFASGVYSTVPGGASNTASGDRSFAAGYRAKATHGGSFVWADTQEADFSSSAMDQFNVRANGGIRLIGNVGVGGAPLAFSGRGKSLVVQGPIYAGGDNATNCHIYVGDDVCLKDEQNGGLNVRQFSDANYTFIKASAFLINSTQTAKKDISPLDTEGMLRTLERLPLYRYRYRNEPRTRARHTGVIAERSPALVLGPDRNALSVSDFLGVTAGATKALSAQVKQLRRENGALKARLAALERQVADLAESR